MNQKYNFNDLTYFLKLKQLEKESIFLIGDDIKIYKFPNQDYIVISKKQNLLNLRIFLKAFWPKKTKTLN